MKGKKGPTQSDNADQTAVEKKILEYRPEPSMDGRFDRKLRNELLAAYSKKYADAKPSGVKKENGLWSFLRGPAAGFAGAVAVIAIAGVTLFINRDNFLQKKPALVEERKMAEAVGPESSGKSETLSAPVNRLPSGKDNVFRAEKAKTVVPEEKEAGPLTRQVSSPDKKKADYSLSLNTPAPERSETDGEIETRSFDEDKLSEETSGGMTDKKALRPSARDESTAPVRTVKYLDEIRASWAPVQGDFMSVERVLITGGDPVKHFDSYLGGSLSDRGYLFQSNNLVYLVHDRNQRTNIYTKLAVSNNVLYLYRLGGKIDRLKKIDTTGDQ